MRRGKSYNSVNFILMTGVLLLLVSCRHLPDIQKATDIPVTGGEAGEIKGFFLLNEGNMGSNKATLDYFDYGSGIYMRNIFATLNPGVTRELGDVGNDIKVYGGKLYAVINCSNLVEVMDLGSGKHIAQISIPNCRYITFDKGYAYVSSYAGPVEFDPTSRKGYVAKIDTLSLTEVASCVVGYQPEEMAISKGKLYVANSGGYRVPNYDRTVSVIDLSTFQVTKTIDVAINLHRMEIDRYGYIYVSSRGDYYDIPSTVSVINSATDEVVDYLELLPCTDMTICGDSLYVYSAAWNNVTQSNTVSYAIYDVKRRMVVSRNFITDGTDKEITVPSGIAVNPENGEILIADAKDYVTPGMLYCFTKEGRKKWRVSTGDIPAHIAFTTKELK